MGFERHHSAWIAASLVTVVSFIGATVYTQNRLASLDALSSTIELNAVPSIEYLSRAAVRLTRLNQLMDDLTASGPRRAGVVTAAREEVAALTQDLDRYVQLPTLTGEQELWTGLQAHVNRAVQMVGTRLNDAQPPHPPTVNGTDQVDEAIDAAVGSVLTTLRYDVTQSEAIAREVRRVRADTLAMIIELDALATLIAAGAVVFALRATRRHERLVGEHSALLSARVNELDRFAGRVAHDVLSPLGTIGMGLSLLEGSSDERARTYIERSRRALLRVQQLVDALLTFARAGARPDPAANCSMDAVLAGLVADEAEATTENGIQLVLEAPQPIYVPCAPGVVTSIAQNLVRNAIKYMGARPTRRITVRASTIGQVARLEVEDTGPGIPPDIQATLFEPFVRGRHDQVPGSGLGLATVKRLVESHHGRVGFKSTVGVGTLFWVELPVLPAVPVDTPPEIEPRSEIEPRQA
jgi:signal transduction histidine kinase